MQQNTVNYKLPPADAKVEKKPKGISFYNQCVSVLEVCRHKVTLTVMTFILSGFFTASGVLQSVTSVKHKIKSFHLLCRAQA